MRIFEKNKCMNICLKNQNPYVRLAVEDMRNDFVRRSIYGVKPQIITEETDCCIIIEDNKTTNVNPIVDEGFFIKSEGNQIRIGAEGYLGTMWGIYTFCEEYLGISPCYLFDDMEVQKIESLEVDQIYKEDKPKSFGFRGVFINDEDLLTGWKDGGGIRPIDYIYYGMTVDEQAMNMVVETILRLKLNLVIPASFLNIDNPPEKKLTDCVAKRGIYLSQHHVEPLGVSHFTLDYYLKKNNKTGEYSYITNPKILDEAWNYYAKKWAEYDNVVWQLGLRGKADRPAWEEQEPTQEVIVEYGKFISKAIEHQRQIVLSATNGKAKFFTSTLWMEGSRLMEHGALELSDEIINVFADAGPNQMYCKEYYTVPRCDNKNYGIYYHVQYYMCGPHLAPQTGIDKLYHNLNLAYENGDNSYIILNVSNIREFVFEIKAYSEMVWDIESFEKQEYVDRYCEKFGKYSAEVKKLITDYYEFLPVLEEHHLSKVDSKLYNFCYNITPENIKNFILKDGRIIALGKMIIENFYRELDGNQYLYKEFYDTLKISLPKWVDLCERFKGLANQLSGSLKQHIEVKWLCYATILRCYYQWYVALYEAKQCYERAESEQMRERLNIACFAIEECLEYRKCAEYGIFENWYRGDVKLDTKRVLMETRRLLGQT